MQHNRGAAGVALVLLAVAAASCGGSDDVTQVAESTTSAPSTSLAEPSESIGVDDPVPAVADEPTVDEMPEPFFQDELRIVWEYVVGDHIGLIESDLGYSPVLLTPDTYETDSMFTPMWFTVSEPTRLIVERHTFLVLVDNSANQLWAPPLMRWMRPHRLTDPAHTAEGPPQWPETIDGWDFDSWFAAHPAIDVAKADVIISGIKSARYDVSFDGSAEVGWDCGGELCVPLVLSYDGPFDLRSDELFRIWVIPQGDFDPIVGIAVVEADDGWDGFGDHVDAIVESLELGEPEPVGFSENIWEDGLDWFVPPGVVQFPILGAVEFEMPKEYFVRQANNWSYINMVDEEWDAFPPNVEIAAAMQTIDGGPIESAEQLAELMVERANATRLPDAELAGRPAVVVEMLGVQPNIPIFRHVALPAGADPGLSAWFTQDFVELWAVDTDNGVLIVTAEADSESALEVARGLHEEIRDTLIIVQ